MSDNKAQPGSHESGTGGETSTTGGDSQVDVKQVLNTETTGQAPEGVNTVPDDSPSGSASKAQPGSQESGTGGETSTAGGDSQTDVKKVLNTETTGQPPANANS